MRARKYAGLLVRVGIAHAFASLSCASALAALGCWRSVLAGRAHWLTVNDCVTKFFSQVCLAAFGARANVDRRRVGVFQFHGC